MKSFKTHKRVTLAVCLVLFLLITGTVGVTSGASSKQAAATQRVFATPEAAVQTLVDAVKRGDKKMAAALFGPRYVPLLPSGDKVQDRADREQFVQAYEEQVFLEKAGDDRIILQVGKEGWPFPFPLVKKSEGWTFDSGAGKEELLNRRIGRNELRVINTMEAYVAAQREYAGLDPAGAGEHAFARKMMSSPGKKDGLYWKSKEGEPESPLGPLVAAAAKEGYTRPGRSKTVPPFQGYYFRILTAQGDKAPGGAYDYLVKGKMLLGFGLIAYPAKYGNSGVMTFMVNQGGVVYQKDLGPGTAKKASAVAGYNPDETWAKAAPKTEVK